MLLAVAASAVAVLAAAWAAAASAASHVYVTAWTNYRVDEFNVGPSGALTSFGSVSAGNHEPWYMAMTSNARNLYLTTFAGNDLEAFTVLPSGGLLHKDTAHGGETPAGTQPVDVAVSPDNKNAYAVNYNSAGPGSVWIYDLAADGSVKPHSPASMPAGKGPYGVAVSRDGKSVYVASQDNNIYEFNRGPKGGLGAKEPPSVTAKALGSGSTPDYLVLTPDGKHLYSANYNDSSIGIFNVGPGGVLSEQPDSPIASASTRWR